MTKLNIEDAIEYLKLTEMVKTSGCDYCNDPTGRKFSKIEYYEWVSPELSTNIRSIKTGDDCWGSPRDKFNDMKPIHGVQHQIHYIICEKCVIEYANKLYNVVTNAIGSPINWYNQYNDNKTK